MEKLYSCKTIEDIEEFITERFPNWLLASISEYSDDYKYLNDNWKFICEKLGVTQKKIIIVDEIKFPEKDQKEETFDKKYIEIANVCEFLTKNGYCVRRVGEIVPCEVCGKALVCQELWANLKLRNLPVPNTWDIKCQNC